MGNCSSLIVDSYTTLLSCQNNEVLQFERPKVSSSSRMVAIELVKYYHLSVFE